MASHLANAPTASAFSPWDCGASEVTCLPNHYDDHGICRSCSDARQNVSYRSGSGASLTVEIALYIPVVVDHNLRNRFLISTTFFARAEDAHKERNTH